MNLVIWKDVEGFEGLYKVSNEGVLVSLPRRHARGRVVKRVRINTGYEMYTLYKDGKAHNELVHRLSAKHFIPNPDSKPFVNHIDGNKSNNNIENLEWVTRQENVEHAVRTGLLNTKGENHPLSKLTDQEVLEIRDLYKNKIYNQRELSEIYGVYHQHISSIVRNKTRKVAGNR